MSWPLPTTTRRKPSQRIGIACITGGIAYRAEEDYNRSIADLSAAIALDPTDAAGFTTRRKSYSAERDYDGAIAEFSEQ